MQSLHHLDKGTRRIDPAVALEARASRMIYVLDIQRRIQGRQTTDSDRLPVPQPNIEPRLAPTFSATTCQQHQNDYSRYGGLFSTGSETNDDRKFIFLAKFRFDTAEKEPAKKLQKFAKI